MCSSTGPRFELLTHTSYIGATQRRRTTADVAERGQAPIIMMSQNHPAEVQPLLSPFHSSGRRVDVGPVRLLPVVRLVVDDARSFEVDDPRKRERARPRTDAALDVLGELVWKGQQNALDDIAFLYREIATIAVGHPSQPALDGGNSRVLAGTALDLRQSIRYLARAEFARRTLTARLDVEEPRKHAGDFDHAGAVVVDDEAPRPHSTVDRLKPLVAHRGVELAPGHDPVRHAREHCLYLATG